MSKLMMIARQLVWNTVSQRAADVQHQSRAYAHYAALEHACDGVDHSWRPVVQGQAFGARGTGRPVRRPANTSALPV